MISQPKSRLHLVLVTLLSLFAASNAQAQQSWQFDPYDVLVWVALDSHGELSASWYTEIAERVKSRSYALIGGIWKTKIELAPAALRSDIVQVPHLLDAGEIAETFRTKVKDRDKVFLAGVKREVDGYRVRVRELDSRTRQLSRVIEQKVGEARLVPNTVASLIVKAFTPLLRLESVRNKKITARLRSGGLVIDPNSPAAVKLADTLRVVIRRNDRAGRPKRIESIPWTVLLVEDVQNAVVNCHMHSGLHGALQRGGGSRTWKLALMVRPIAKSTLIHVLSKKEPRTPLAGYEVYAKDPEMPLPKPKETEKPQGDGSGPIVIPEDYVPRKPVKIGVTDWQGRYVVQAMSDRPLRVIYIKSGRRLLARMPLVPGAIAKEEVFLRSDDKRIQAESYVDGIKQTAMELVIQRFDYIVRVRRSLIKKDKDKANELLEKLKLLPNAGTFNAILDRGQRSISSPDVRMQARITKLFNDTRALLNKYLDQKTVDGVAIEVATGKPKDMPGTTGKKTSTKKTIIPNKQ